MKKILIILFIAFIGNFAFGQGYGVSSVFYPDSIPINKEYDQKYWKKQAQKISKAIRETPNNSILLYKLAIAKSKLLSKKSEEIIGFLDRAIAVDSTMAEYYAVRGIIKYDWGAYSPDYDIAEGCPDIRKALEMGLSDKFRNDDAIIGILNHPSCKMQENNVLGTTRPNLDHIVFIDSITNIEWTRVVENGADSYSINFTDSSFRTINPKFKEMDLNCSCKIVIDQNYFKVQNFRCDNKMMSKFIYGFVDENELYLSYETKDIELNENLPLIIENRLGWAKFIKANKKE